MTSNDTRMPASAVPSVPSLDVALDPPDGHGTARADWVIRAQDGQAPAVLAEIDAALRGDLMPADRVHALYTQGLALGMTGRLEDAVQVARDLTTYCRDVAMFPAGVKARALLGDLLRRSGEPTAAAEQLAQAVAQEAELSDLHDSEVQTALGALAVALRLSGVPEEARRVEARLSAVESELPEHQRVARWSNLAFEHAVQAMAAARRPPYRPDAPLLDRAVADIGRALALTSWGSYDVISDEAAVLRGFKEAVCGDAAAGRRRLEACAGVLERGREAVAAQLFWAAGSVRALVRLGRPADAARLGAHVLATVQGSGYEGDRLILAYETMRAEHPGAEDPGSGTAAFVDLAERRLGEDQALVEALFRVRVDLLRGADERRHLARAASLDPLTGLVNRRGAGDSIDAAAARPAGEPVALLLIDLDGFKDVNDTYGHLAGDALLQRVAVALRTAARLDDVVARWGGDEFVVVAGLGPDRAFALADRLRDTIRESVRQTETVRVTGSIGVSVRDAPVDAETWLRRADEAMYAAKRSGGDATVLG